jgi:S-adenosyl-L-methionine hydrolase (adenosine-forming)
VPGYQWISFLSDFGVEDGFAAACRGVIAQIAPSVRVIDVTHAVSPGDVRRGAAVLAQTIRHLPPSVHVAVVDPGVGTKRRAVAVVAGGHVLVGPENGLIPWAADVLGGPERAFEITNTSVMRHPVSKTFHGRDVFAPAAAHLALGADPAQLGPRVSPESLVRLAPPVAEVSEEGVLGEVALVDGFGNLQTSVPADRAALPVGTRVPLVIGDSAATATVGRTFADVPAGELLLYVDSSGYLAVAVNGGSAARTLGAGIGAQVRIGRHLEQHP